MKSSFYQLSVCAFVWCILGLNSVVSAADNTCFCLKEEQSELRNPIHIEPVIISGRKLYLLAEQRGIIYLFDPQESGVNRLVPYIDLSSKVVTSDSNEEQRGLLGFAIHPDFGNTKKVFVYTIRNVLNKDYAVISEITAEDLEAEKMLLLIDQYGPKRNGGQLLFGDDGFLYAFIGDGDPENDTDIKAQDGMSLHGKVLRLDVDQLSVHDYRLQYFDVPADNPEKEGWRPEIYAAGMRNTWKCFIDGGDQNGTGKGRIFCGELGSSLSDEINLLQKGANYGWPLREGRQCRASNITDCNNIVDEVLPIWSLNGSTTAVVGGPVYRGSIFSSLYGGLMYGDYVSSKLYSLEQNNDTWTEHMFNRCESAACACDARHSVNARLLSFGQTHDGELLLLMTSESNPTQPKGMIMSLRAQSGQVTCGSPPMLQTLHSYIALLCMSLSMFLCIS